MDRERLDSLIDRELRRELLAQPSAGFHARLDERLALERDRRIGPRWWIFAATLGAAAAAVIAVVLLRPPVSGVPLVPAPRITAPSPPPFGPVAAQRPASAGAPAPRAARNTSAPGPEAPLREVEVIVPSGQADALKRFTEDLNDSVANGRWVPVLAGGSPNSVFYILPTAPTIEHLPMAGSYNSEKE